MLLGEKTETKISIPMNMFVMTIGMLGPSCLESVSRYPIEEDVCCYNKHTLHTLVRVKQKDLSIYLYPVRLLFVY